MTREEARVEGFVFEAAAAAGYPAHFWDVAQGVVTATGKKEQVGSPDIEETLNAIRERAENGTERGVWVLRDLPVWLNGPIGAKTLRQLRDIVPALSPPLERAQPVIIITPDGTVPPELTGHATVIEFPLPDRTEIPAVRAAQSTHCR